MLKIRTVGIIKSLFEQGKKHKDINNILIAQGLIMKPLSHKTLRNIRNGVTHSAVIPYYTYVNAVAAKKKALASKRGLTDKQ